MFSPLAAVAVLLAFLDVNARDVMPVPNVADAADAVTTLAGPGPATPGSAYDDDGSQLGKKHRLIYNYPPVDGTGTNAGVGSLYAGLVLDSSTSTIYFADYDNPGVGVRAVNVATRVVTTVVPGSSSPCTAGAAGSNSIKGPSAISPVVGGDILVGSFACNSIYRITLSTRAMTFVVGGKASTINWNDDGVGTNAYFYLPAGIAWDGGAVAFVSDKLAYSLRRVVLDAVTGIGNVTIFAGSPTRAQGVTNGFGACCRRMNDDAARKLIFGCGS